MILSGSRLAAHSATRCLQRSYISEVKAEHKARMSIQQPPWKLPERQTDDPVLKIYNSLTRTKVSALILTALDAALICQCRPNSYLGVDVMSNGTTAAPPSMMPRTWDMLGKTILVQTTCTLHGGSSETMSHKTYCAG